MTKLISIIATILVFVVAPIIGADIYWDNGFLEQFLKEQSLPIMGAILAIYIAASASLLVIMLNHESEKGSAIFNGTSKELKQNIIFVIALFVIHLLLMVATPKSSSDNQILITVLKAAKVFTFSLYVYALYELSHVLFGIRDTLNKYKK